MVDILHDINMHTWAVYIMYLYDGTAAAVACKLLVCIVVEVAESEEKVIKLQLLATDISYRIRITCTYTVYV